MEVHLEKSSVCRLHRLGLLPRKAKENYNFAAKPLEF